MSNSDLIYLLYEREDSNIKVKYQSDNIAAAIHNYKLLAFALPNKFEINRMEATPGKSYILLSNMITEKKIIVRLFKH